MQAEEKKRRRMAFFEIARGRFAENMQTEFEQAQKIAAERKGQVTLTAKIVINPPDPQDPNYSTIKYSIKTSTPSITSKEFSSELKNGYIIDDGDDVAALIQERLNFTDLPSDVEMRLGRVANQGE